MNQLRLNEGIQVIDQKAQEETARKVWWGVTDLPIIAPDTYTMRLELAKSLIHLQILSEYELELDSDTCWQAILELSAVRWSVETATVLCQYWFRQGGGYSHYVRQRAFGRDFVGEIQP